jgi:uncharacterized protein YndB with AHSA1/START domain
MTTAPTIPAIRRRITVAAPIERAFRVFTESFDTWWPRGHHIGAADLAQAVIQPYEGGRWYERGTDGSECDWGRVMAWQPPRRLLLTWQINGEWAYDPDPAHASEIEVLFSTGPDGQTIVDLEHRLFDRLAAGRALYDGVGGEGGWNGLLQQFATAAADQS